MVNIKCMSRVRVSEDEFLSSFCRNRLNLVSGVYRTVLYDDVNITMELHTGGIGCLPSQVKIGRWCVYLGGCNFSKPTSLSLTYSEDVVNVVKDIVYSIEDVVGRIPHNWYIERISADIPFCKSERGIVKHNGEIYVKYGGSMIPTKNGYIEYNVSFPEEFSGLIILSGGKYGVRWLINDDFTVTPTDEGELNRLGEFGKELNIHANLTAKIAEVIIDKSCDLLYNIVNFLIEYFSVRNLYP